MPESPPTLRQREPSKPAAASRKTSQSSSPSPARITIPSEPKWKSRIYHMALLSLFSLALFQTLAVLGQDFINPQSYVAYENAYGGDIPPKLLEILRSNESRVLGQYPTSFTKGIIPKQLHSHNDYWRDVPYYSALSVGAISVEADIWLKNGTLYVGHEESALTKKRTLESLYINPIMDTLQRQNPTTPFVDGSSTINGVFDTNAYQTLYLWLDCKTSGGPTFSAAIKALEPLRKAGYLTQYTKKYGVLFNSVTVIGTGNTPLNMVEGVSPRDYFWDAPLTELGKGKQYEHITSDISPIASTDFLGAGFAKVGMHGLGAPVFSDAELERLRDQIATAKKKGIGARYWDTPGWPVRVRNAIWRTVWSEGAALVNVDDLADAAFGDWSS